MGECPDLIDLLFYKAGGLDEVDIILESPVSYEAARKGAIRVKAGDITMPVISIDDLIKMKKKTSRAVDKFDIEQLKKIRKLRKEK